MTFPTIDTQTGSGTNDNDQVIDFSNTNNLDTFMLMSTAGAMDVLVSLDGTNFTTAPLSLTDMGGTSTAPVVVTVAGRLYGFRGKFAAIRVLQNGATAVENAVLHCGTM